MSSRGGCYEGPGGQLLFGDGREVSESGGRAEMRDRTVQWAKEGHTEPMTVQQKVTAQIAAMRAVMEKATQGKWETRSCREIYSETGPWTGSASNHNNASAIALSVNAMKSNLDAIERLANKTCEACSDGLAVTMITHEGIEKKEKISSPCEYCVEDRTTLSRWLADSEGRLP